MERILSKGETARRAGVSPQTWERLELAAVERNDPNFPQRRQIARGGRVGYLESEVDIYLRGLPRGPLTERTAAARAARQSAA